MKRNSFRAYERRGGESPSTKSCEGKKDGDDCKRSPELKKENMTNIKKISFYCLVSLLVLLLHKPFVDAQTIKAGTAKLTGSIKTPNNKNRENISVDINISHPISGEYVNYKAQLDNSGKFAIDIDVEMAISLISLNTSLNQEQSLLIKLNNGGITNVDIAYNSADEIENISISPNMNKYDITQSFEILSKMIGYRPDRAPTPLYNKTTDYFLDYAKSVVTERLGIFLNKDSLLSEELKEVLTKDFSVFMYNAHVFDYKDEMLRNYHNTNMDKSETPDIQKIDKTYFRFLRDFKLNDPQYLYAFTFQEFQKTILQNETLAIPEIGESDIPSWLAGVKVILSDLVGFNDGPYYDILAANAYGRQLTEEQRPLSEKQKMNISNYWKDGEIAKILFRKNLKVVELNKFKSPVVVNDISSVPADKVIETILEKYKNKVVFMDLWATWCAPCLDAMVEFRNTKSDFHDKDVVFVYLTNGSSPRKLWEEKIKGIGSEHYYLTSAQWEYIMDHFGLSAIPSYLLYDKQGKLINKFTAFPGNKEVKEMIDRLL